MHQSRQVLIEDAGVAEATDDKQLCLHGKQTCKALSWDASHCS